MSETLTGTAAIEAICQAINRDFWSGRLPQIKAVWDSDPNFAARIWPDGELWLGEQMASYSRRVLVGTLAHELCHLAVREAQEHGPRWQGAMRRIGLCPATGGVILGGPIDAWLRRRGW